MEPKVGVLLLLAVAVTAASARSGGSSPTSDPLPVTKSSAPPARLAEQQVELDDDDDAEVQAVVTVDKAVKQSQAGEDADEYGFGYAVRDDKEPRQQQGERRRTGPGVVLGSYSLLSADGSQRTVQYSAHPVHGFAAVVRRDAGVGAALFVKSPFPTAAPTPAVVLVRPQQPLVFGPPQQLVYQGVSPAPQLLQAVTPTPPRLQQLQQVQQVQPAGPAPLPAASLVAVDVQRSLEPSAEGAVVNIGGRERTPAVAAAVSEPTGRARSSARPGPQFLLQPLPVLALAPASLDAPPSGPPAPSSFFYFSQQQHQQPGAPPPAPAAHRAFFSLPLVQYGPAPAGPAPAPAAQASSPAVYRFPHPDPPVHFATSGQGYTSAVFTAFTSPYVSYAY